jgi:ribosomal protein S12 methylthiotransferase accessory factor
VAVVKVIVPGLEVETMSYHRLGARNARRLIERGDPLIKFGAPSATLKPVRMPPEQVEALGAPLFDTALADRIVGSLYPLYREPEAHHVAWMLGQAAAA